MSRGRGATVAAGIALAVLLGSRDAPAQDSTSTLEAQVRSIVGKLAAIDSGADQWSIHDLLGNLVVLGDAAVPELTGTLASGRDKKWKIEPTTRSGRYYLRLRAVVLEALFEIRTPSARDGLLKGLGTAISPEDLSDILCLNRWPEDTVFTEGVSAFIPGLLRRVEELGLAEAHRRHRSLVPDLLHWIHWRSMKGTKDAIERILVQTPLPRDEVWSSYQGLFTQLAEFSVEGAVEVLRRLREKETSDRFVSDLSSGLSARFPHARLVQYYELLLDKVKPGPITRGYLYCSAPISLYEGDGTVDPKAAVEDAKVLTAFLEKRLSIESDAGTKEVIEAKLLHLKQAIERAPKATR